MRRHLFKTGLVALLALAVAGPSLGQQTKPTTRTADAKAPAEFVARKFGGPAGESGATMKVPPEWVEKPGKMALSYGAAQSPENVNVVVIPVPPGVTAEVLAAQLPALLTQQIKGAKVVASEVVKFNKFDAAHAELTLSSNNLDLVISQYYVIGTKHGYIVTFTDLAKGFEGHRAAFEQVMASATLP